MNAEKNQKLFQIRNLTYTLPKLLLVGALMNLATLLLGLICYNIVPTIKPLLLDKYGASATVIALVIGTIPQAINFILCPIISTMSDKTRSKWGRRTPYLLFSAPFLVGLMLMMAWVNELSALCGKFLPFLAANNVNTTLWILCIVILLFQVLYLFPGSVVYYLIADVIPKECMGRYMSISSFLSSGMGFLFNLVILKFAVNHMKITFSIVGALYLAVFILQYLFVKEGQYPPVEDSPSAKENFLIRGKEYFLMFFRECFRYKIYVFLFLCTGLNQASNICRSMYNILFATKDIGMSVETYGYIMAAGSITAAVIVLFVGRIMDKTHPLLIYFLGGIFIIVINVFGFFFVNSTATFAVIGIATGLMYAIQHLANTPLLIHMVPVEKYGQFASANSMVNSLTVFFAAYLGGKMTDIFGYRLMFAWDFFVTILATFSLIVVYKEWKKMGGKKGYIPPKA